MTRGGCGRSRAKAPRSRAFKVRFPLAADAGLGSLLGDHLTGQASNVEEGNRRVIYSAFSTRSSYPAAVGEIMVNKVESHCAGSGDLVGAIAEGLRRAGKDIGKLGQPRLVIEKQENGVGDVQQRLPAARRQHT